MENDRLRVPVDPDYAAALGLATYCFASLEWNAVSCGDKLRPGYVNLVPRKTAGEIAKDVCAFADMIADRDKRARFRTAAEEFKRLVERRNALMHANPATVDGRQRLVRDGFPWNPAGLEELADEFTACSLELNELHHHVL